MFGAAAPVGRGEERGDPQFFFLITPPFPAIEMGGCMSSSSSSAADYSGGGTAYGDIPRGASGGAKLGGSGAQNPKMSASEAARQAALARMDSRPADLKASDERDAKNQLVARITERYRRAGREPPFGLAALTLPKLRVMSESNTLP